MDKDDTADCCKPLFKKLLIANRGEIACRIARTARRLQIQTVAVYSDADTDALHVRAADEAVRIGPSLAAESYLNAEAILRAAEDTDAEAVHPGYGFLSENADFAERVDDAGLAFIGPPVAAIRAMGAKNAAKQLMETSQVPVVPGYHGDDQNEALLLREAERIGFPVLIKPVAGGGGKGMRVARSLNEFAARLAESRREAVSFGNTDVIVEKLIRQPRHIEVQIFGDIHGNVIHLFERDCTLQRRHQKIIEECPAPGIDDRFRSVICAAAVRAARAVGYIGAGTVEFIADGSDGLRPDRFWFMEMNTRLQVEHPVTEEALGIDLVEWQLRAAAGRPLPFDRVPERPGLCAIEGRIYAEDPANGFLPSAGRLVCADMPKGIRVDSGVDAGDGITPFYDPMIAKFIAVGRSREDARRSLLKALRETDIRGVNTNIALLVELTASEAFGKAKIDTGTVDRRFAEAGRVGDPPIFALALAAVRMIRGPEWQPPETGFTLWRSLERTITFRLGDRTFETVVRADGPDQFRVFMQDGLVECRCGDHGWQLDGEDVGAGAIADGGHIFVFRDGIWKFTPVDHLDADGEADPADNSVTAPMPGIVRMILAVVGDRVEAGDRLAIMEAMKMELSLQAPCAGTVAEICVEENSQVTQGDDIVRIKAEFGAKG